MTRFLLMGALTVLAGCQDSLESQVKEAAKHHRSVLVADSVELREVRKNAVGSAICGLISYETNFGRTSFNPFILRDGNLRLVAAEGSAAQVAFDVHCATSQP